MHEIIKALKQKNLLWNGTKTLHQANVVPSGYTELDNKLGGGFPNKGVIEINTFTGIGELRLLDAFLSNITDDRLRVFIHPPGKICGEFFVTQGYKLDKIIVVSPKNGKEALWATEQSLKSGACSHVLLWCDTLEIHQVKRLQMASETGHCSLVIFKPQKQTFPLPVSLSLNLEAHSTGLKITINKRKGRLGRTTLCLDMSRHWMNLTKAPTNNIVVPFPLLKRR
ncbi:translesion DNA synthesis-associated protein ImuA [Vibrio sp. S9_S30]|uniref:translesion DNA synthesis-associated protein ImuA n=1 Tax=Vibrio sp. S9_S30 TaxID=2720226 RepID=UPI0016809B27|nr:translesion DNA synthesis-associated protein ImuA [Vibrio sp. S9_S30]MBD1557895.1 translesion DNA synthesis-associated protein ImuA [Vibrio sp. S9_S30]